VSRAAKACLGQLGAGQRQELLVVLRQRLRGELGEGAGQQRPLLVGPRPGLVLAAPP